MPAQPIYIDADEEISELIDRLRQTPAADVPVVVPSRSRIGQSRFNFRLLRDYARQFGKRISIVSPDPAIQQLAAEIGFSAFAAVDEVREPAAEPALAMAGVGTTSAPSGPLPYQPPPAPVARTPKLAMSPQRRLPSTQTGGAWWVLYLGTAIVAVVAFLFAAIVLPSASVTLTAKAQDLSDTTSVVAAPNSAPVKVRTVTAGKDLSQQFPATGQKDTPAVAASGTESITNSCTGSVWNLKQGQIFSTGAGGGGTQFVLQTNAQVGDVPQAVPILAVAPGAGGNVGAGTIVFIYNNVGAKAGCLTASNPSATGGGADEVKSTFVSQGDLDGAQGSLATQLQASLLAQLSQQAGSSEKLADTVDYKNTFAADHGVNDNVKFFNATVSETATGAVYNVDDVKAALKADLVKHVPAGFALTDNAVQSDFHVADSTADGHISFTGTAHGYIAPKLDFQKVRSRLLGSTTASARIYLQTLPIESATVSQKPFNLPLLPLLSSRINIRYVVDTGTATASPPTS